MPAKKSSAIKIKDPVDAPGPAGTGGPIPTPTPPVNLPPVEGKPTTEIEAIVKRLEELYKERDKLVQRQIEISNKVASTGEVD